MSGRILIVDDVATNRIVLKVKLAAACYDVLQARDAEEALALARRERPDLVMLDIVMPGMDGIELCRRLRSAPDTAAIPVIMVTALNDVDARLRALEAGADEFLSRPFDEMTLLARVRSLLRARDIAEELRLRDATCRAMGFAEAPVAFSRPARVALVSATRADAVRWKAELADELDARIEILAPEAALDWDAKEPAPDVFVISGNLRRPDEGLRLLSELRSRAPTRHSAIVMILDRGARQQAVIALDLGASDLMMEGFPARELALRINTQVRRKRMADRLRDRVDDGLRLAMTDPLTGLYNRRYALAHLERIAARACDTGRHFAIMMLDLDRFKSVNDRFGHAAGDMVLAAVAQRLRENLRSADLVARVGGEEFLVAMPDTDLAEARIAAERLRRAVEDSPVQSEDSGRDAIGVTLSIGVAMGGGGDAASCDTDMLIRRADSALYGSKAEGRNQVTFAKTAA